MDDDLALRLLEEALKQQQQPPQQQQSGQAQSGQVNGGSTEGNSKAEKPSSSSSSSSRRRSRSRSRERHGSSRRGHSRERRERSRERGSDRDRDRHERRRSPSPHRSRRPSPPRGGGGGGRRKSPSPLPDDPERERRTLFCMQLAARLTHRELTDFFKNKGCQVVEALILTDRISGRSKGCAYVEFVSDNDVAKALGLTGEKLLGIPISIQMTQAEKNRIAAQNAALAAAAKARNDGPTRLYVGNLDSNLTDDDVKLIFEPFGPLAQVYIERELDGRSKGFAYVQYRRAEDTRLALEQMNNFDLGGGRLLRVGIANQENTFVAPASNFASFIPSTLSAQKASLLDDSDTRGVSLGGMARVELMQKLNRGGEIAMPGSVPVNSMSPGSLHGATASAVGGAMNPSKCILLKNMFDPSAESGFQWEEDIKQDVTEECSKYGRVIHAFVDRHSDGHVYLKFDSIISATAAANALNGRWFSGKQIVAEFMAENAYTARFPDSIRPVS